MREHELCKQLSRKVTKDLGATPFSFGKVSVTHPDLLLKRKLKITEEGVVIHCPMWYGEAKGNEGFTCVLMTALNDLEELKKNADEIEVVCIIGFKSHTDEFESGSINIGFLYNWGDDNDPGHIYIKAGEKWLPMTLTQKLQFSLGLESATQDGVLWSPRNGVPEELLKNLSEMIEVDVDSKD